MAFDGHYLDWNQKRIKGIVDFYGYKFMYMKKLLDLGCGYADISGVLHRLGADVTAVDARADHLKIVTKKFSGIKTVQADLDRGWPFQGKSFDIVLDLGVICHLSNFESHLRDVCASTTHLVLETAVCDSDDPNKCVKVAENKGIYDLSVNGLGCRPSAAAIERVLENCGMSFKRLDDAKFNAGPYTYSWRSKNDGNTNIHNRRIWFAVKKSNASQFIQDPAPVLNTPNAPGIFSTPPNHTMPFVKQWSAASPTPPYSIPTVPGRPNPPLPNYIAPPAPVRPSTPLLNYTAPPTISTLAVAGTPKTRLFYHYYDEVNSQKKQEIDLCLQNNITNQLFDIIVLNSDDKPTFDFFFQKINQLAGPNDISIICSSDMFFDKTISLISKIETKSVYALSCWNWHRNGTISAIDRADSQGAWVVKGIVTDVSGNFIVGNPGSDGRIAHELEKAGYKITNPCRSIKVFQVRDSGFPIFDEVDRVSGPTINVEPTSL